MRWHPVIRAWSAALLSMACCSNHEISPAAAPMDVIVDKPPQSSPPRTVDEPPTMPAVELPSKPCWGVDDQARIDRYEQVVRQAARTYDIDESLVLGLIWVESKFRADARGPGGSRGLMQLMPATSKSIAAKIGRAHRPSQPDFNVHAGTYYLDRMLRRFAGDEVLALAAYNRGPGRVAEWVETGADLPDTTRGFVERVQRARDCFRNRSPNDAGRGLPVPQSAGR